MENMQVEYNYKHCNFEPRVGLEENGKIKIALFREYKIRLFLQEPTS